MDFTGFDLRTDGQRVLSKWHFPADSTARSILGLLAGLDLASREKHGDPAPSRAAPCLCRSVRRQPSTDAGVATDHLRRRASNRLYACGYVEVVLAGIVERIVVGRSRPA